MINPDHISIVDGDGITSPDVLGVDLSDEDVPRKVNTDVHTRDMGLPTE